MKQKTASFRTMGKKRLLAALLTLGLLIPESSMAKAADTQNQTTIQEHDTQVQTADQTDNYIITLEENQQGDAILHKLNDITTEESRDYSELPGENIAVIEADENTIKELKKEDGVHRIEEDIILNGSKKSASPKNNTADSRLIKKKQKKIAEWKDKTSTEDTGASWNIQMVGADKIAPSEKQSQSGDTKTAKTPETNSPGTSGAHTKIRVAVIDSGMDMTEHYDVKEHINFVKDEEDVELCYEDRTGHGTAIAGIIAGNENGIPGINPDVELYSLKVLDENNQSPVSRIIEAIHWCIRHDIQIINMSFGTSLGSPALRNAVAQAADAGILMTAAAGNTGGSVEYPAAYKPVMAVGSIDSHGEVSHYSCDGSSVEILAPGEKILTEGAFSGVTVASGTSMAVPHVTGAASLIWQKDPSVSAAFVRELLKASAKNVEGRDEGILDVEYALEQYDAFKKAYDENKSRNENETSSDSETANNETIEKETDILQESADEIKSNNNTLETFRTDELVEGSWGHTLHEDSVTKGMKEWGPSKAVDVSTIRKFAAMADKKPDPKKNIHTEGDYNYRETNGLHGGGNYVAAMQYIYNVAKRVEDGKSVADAIKATKYKGSLTNKENGYKGAEVKKGMDGAMKAISKNGKTNREKSQRILALAVHVAGDMYAHESMVPEKAAQNIEKGIAKVTGNYFRSGHFGKYWDGTKKIVSAGEMKFVNIKEGILKNKVPEKESPAKLYEDNINFYPSRYKRATIYTVGCMLYDMYEDKSYFNSWCLVPGLYQTNGYNIKRFKVYDFAVECCSDTLIAEEKAMLYKYNAIGSKKVEK